MLVEGSNIYTSDISKATLLNTFFVEQSTLDLSNEPDLLDFIPERDLKTGASIQKICHQPGESFCCVKIVGPQKSNRS